MEKTMQDILQGVPPYEGKEDYVFVSYCHKDLPEVLPILQRLQGAGIRFWYDAGIDPGTEWPESIARHLLDCKVCMAVITPASQDSNNCRREIHYALSKRKGFLSVFLQPTELTPGLELQMSPYQSLAKYLYSDEELFFEKLLSLENLTSCRTGLAPQPPRPAPGPVEQDGRQPGEDRAAPSGDAAPQTYQGHAELERTKAEAVRALCAGFIQSHDAALFRCTKKLKAGLGIADMADSDVYLAHDDTFMHSGKNGFAVTRWGMFSRDLLKSPVYASYETLAGAEKITMSYGTVYADDAVVAVYTDSDGKSDLVQLFRDIAQALR